MNNTNPVNQQLELQFNDEVNITSFRTPSENKIAPPSTSIEDFGEKIGGAKKDLAKIYKERILRITDNDLLSQPLHKLFPRPDLQSLVLKNLINQEQAILINYIFDNLPSKPNQNSYSKEVNNKIWLAEVYSVMNFVHLIIAQSITEKPMQSYIDKLIDAHKNNAALSASVYLKIYTDLNFPKEKIKLGNFQIKHLEHPQRYLVINNGHILFKSADLNESIDYVKNKIHYQSSKQKVNIQIYRNPKNNEIFIGKVITGQNPAFLKGDFPSVNSARLYLEEHREELEQQWQSINISYEERNAENAIRIGNDIRGGQNIDTEIFQAHFGFRGGEFGNWVKQDTRQKLLNETFEAITDLVQVLDIDPKVISLNGQLGIAFGARGSGSASAHYEPDKVVINLTKTKGAGCFAHEWWHALDNYFSRLGGNRLGFVSDGSSIGLNIRKELKQAFDSVLKTLYLSDFYKRSASIDSYRSTPYWKTGREMTARAFESYIKEKLKDKGIQNDYLVNIKSPKGWNKSDYDIRKYPYPLPEEMPEIIRSFDNFFASIQYEKKDEQVILFSCIDDKFQATSQDLRYSIIGEKGAANDPDILKNLGIAQLMEKNGKTSEEIYLATGWEHSQDKGRWKYDLPADNIKYLAGIKGQKHFGEKTFTDTLSNILDYERLYKCYPDLKDMKVNFIQNEKENYIGGEYSNNQIYINTYNTNTLEQLESLIHEIQHAIQDIEGFSRGGNIEMFEEKRKDIYRDIIFYTDAFKDNEIITPSSISTKLNSIIPYTEITYKEACESKLTRVAKKYGFKNIDDLLSDLNKDSSFTKYNKLAGEVEARNAASRLNMTARERAMTPISFTEDVTEANKIYQDNKDLSAISSAINKMSCCLNTPVTIVNSRSELPDYILSQMSDQYRYRGVFEKQGKIHIILNEIKDVGEAQSVMLHEVLAHKGLRVLFPNEKTFESFLDKVWNVIPEQEKQSLLRLHKNKSIAAEEYLATFAEGYHDPKLWEKVKFVIKDFFRKLGIDLKISDNDLKNILHAAKKTLTRSNQISSKMQNNMSM